MTITPRIDKQYYSFKGNIQGAFNSIQQALMWAILTQRHFRTNNPEETTS